MSLLCDGKEIQPVERSRFPVKLPSGYGAPEGAVAIAGDYHYSFDALDPTRCRRLELRIVSDDNTDSDARVVPAKTLQQVRADFEECRNASWGVRAGGVEKTQTRSIAKSP
jgi:hypothetical protein